MEGSLKGSDARELAETLIRSYFQTQDYPFTRHHIESYDQFISQDIGAIIKAENPFTLLQDQIGTTDKYRYKAEIFIGGLNGDKIYIGTPALSQATTSEIRILFPNEARLRNLTYASMVHVDIVIRITNLRLDPSVKGRFIQDVIELSPERGDDFSFLSKVPLFKIPIMLHSRYCLLHGKPQGQVESCCYCTHRRH